MDRFNITATAIFGLAVLHTFAASRIAIAAQRAEMRRTGNESPGIKVELLHLLGEVEVVFGLWAVPLVAAFTWFRGWAAAVDYVNAGVSYTEPLLVVVVMALASTRPIVILAERLVGRVAGAGGGTPAAWWVAILTIAPLLGSFITEPAAMTIAALLLARQFFDLSPSRTLRYATLGLLFVNVSIGGTLTHFAAPPVLIVARPWGWDTWFMATTFGWKAVLAIVLSTMAYYVVFRQELGALAARPPVFDRERPDDDASPTATLLPVPAWVAAVHVAFLIWTVVNAHYPALFVGGFLFFLGFARATAPFQSRVDLRTPLLVGFFLAGLVIHGGLQGWWIAPLLSRLHETPLFLGATLLTAFNDNALITYLATLVPSMDEPLRIAVVEGAVTGGGLTVIANAPNPAGQALLSRFFGGAVHPLWLLLAALPPTIVAATMFRLL